MLSILKKFSQIFLAREELPVHEHTPIADMFALYPIESVIVMTRGLELGMASSTILLAHCLYIVICNIPSSGFIEPTEATLIDRALLLLCILRIIIALPRPLFWLRTRRDFIEARYLSTPQQITARLLDIYSHPFKIERILLFTYYTWLACVTALLCLLPISFPHNIEFAKTLWRHLLLNLASLVFHRVACVSLFYWLMESEFKRGIPAEILDRFTDVTVYHSGWLSNLICTESNGSSRENEVVVKDHRYSSNDCAICYTDFQDGDRIRGLRCGHDFHAACVDMWLLEHQNRCPLCLRLVGPMVSIKR
ncbi:ring finger protein, putative [Perkinsus marinus ATCC 50983]|uniref:Ring finger protein, putative n=1 Tax=Perkinsus marinus (strain ATCC 50983 / TXsc) TaxID=423536 RepID=C5LL61_PERM5|nr:ring finger protein, putative [Perkinsus marinus ATCC 50983]EER02531.1 ring finger protein, putative [Perkinsus marinus ATCC 50983]|eukprot:XP_002769813.1 ring finger protein, putative [Perkinsus marinus ATCC 50983]